MRVRADTGTRKAAIAAAESLTDIQRIRCQLKIEARLRNHGVVVDQAEITSRGRKAAYRAAIVAAGLGEVILWRTKHHHPITYGEAYERLFGEPLYGQPR
jgi:hypothetical protein